MGELIALAVLATFVGVFLWLGWSIAPSLLPFLKIGIYSLIALFIFGLISSFLLLFIGKFVDFCWPFVKPFTLPFLFIERIYKKIENYIWKNRNQIVCVFYGISGLIFLLLSLRDFIFD